WPERPRGRGALANGAGIQRPGDRRPTRAQRQDRRDLSHPRHAQTEPAPSFGPRALCATCGAAPAGGVVAMAEGGGAVVAVVLGAGQGTRMGAGRNKVLLTLRGKPILVLALAAFEQTPQVTETLLVAHPDEVAMCREMVAEFGLAKVAAVIPGGVTRHQSEER